MSLQSFSQRRQSALALLFLALLSYVGCAAADVGLIAALKGPVQVKTPKNANWAKASMMQSLPDDAHLQVGAGGQAVVVLFEGGARYQLAANSEVAVSANNCRAVSGPAPKTLAALPIRQAALLKSSSVAMGRPASTVLRGGARPIPLNSLADTAILETRPTFSWQAIPGATSYQIQLWDDADRTIWKTDVTTISVAYPADSPELKSGVEYLWQVTTRVEGNAFKGEGAFRILSPEASAAVTKELAETPQIDANDDIGDAAVAGILRAEVFVRAGLWDEAIRAYQKLSEQFPDSQSVRETLVGLQTAQGRSVAEK